MHIFLDIVLFTCWLASYHGNTDDLLLQPENIENYFVVTLFILRFFAYILTYISCLF